MEVDISNIYYTISAVVFLFTTPVRSGFTISSPATFDGHVSGGTCKLAVVHSEEEFNDVLTAMTTASVSTAYIGLQYKGDSYVWTDYTPFVFSNFTLGHGAHHAIICPDQGATTIACDPDKFIRLQYAHYGRTSTKECSTNPYDQPASGSCWNPATYDTLRSTCNGMSSCEVSTTTFSATTDCVDSDQQYVEMVYDCVPDTLKTSSCVYVDAETRGWHQTECTTEMPGVCEAYVAPTAALVCVDYEAQNTKVQQCPAEQPVVVGCNCPCPTYAIDEEATTCTCLCDTNTTVTATCCPRTINSPNNPGYDRNPTLGCSVTKATDQASCAATGEQALSCAPFATTKTATSCARTGEQVASWCCQTSFANPAMGELFEQTTELAASEPQAPTSEPDLDSCFKKCIDDSRCLGVTYTSDCTIYHKVERSKTPTPADFYRRRYPPYSSNMLADYDPVLSSMNWYVRKLDGIAVGNVTYDTCLESCTEEDTCEHVDWRSDGICYCSYLSNGTSCRLLTNAPYQATSAHNIKDALRYGIILHCYWSQKITTDSCQAGYTMTSCSCGANVEPIVLADASSCTCETSSATNTSTAIQCCRYVKTAPRVCPPGKHLNMTTATCKPCPPGLISTGFGSKCAICPPGHVSNTTGSSNCTACEKDWIPDVERRVCQPCPMGHYTNGTGYNSCFPVDCGPPPNVSNANVTVNTTTFASVSSYMCHPGYMMANATSFLVCGCLGNWTGQNFTCEDIDECESIPCQNNATCNNMINSYNCTCLPGYTGFNCETEIDECASFPCDNGGNCTDRVNEYNCTCVPGYTGINCETDIDECSSEPCQNAGTCVDAVNGYTCTCTSGYSGADCETDVDECAAIPCRNNGTCTQGVPPLFTCTCAPGFTGTICETDINECGSSPCINGGTCEDRVNDFNCQCPLPFTGKICDIKYEVSGCYANSSNAQLLTGTTQSVKHFKMNPIACVNYCNMYTLKYSATTNGDTCTCGSTLAENPGPGTCNRGCSANSAIMCGGADTTAANLTTVTTIQPKSAYPSPIGCYPSPTAGSEDLDMTFPHSEVTFDNCLKGCGCMDYKYFSINGAKCICLSSKPSTEPLVETSCDQNCADDTTKKCGNTGDTNTNIYGASVLASNADPCISNPCQYNGTCSNYTLPSGAPFYNCSCMLGIEGVNCETNIDECASNPCQNGGNCTDGVNMYTCQCVIGYTGPDCETIYNCSTPKALQNGTRDFPAGTTYGESATYQCDTGFFLGNDSNGIANCTITGWQYPILNCYSVDECVGVTCQNGGVCVDQHLNYTCKCACPYTGRHCESVVDCGVAPNITHGYHDHKGNSSYGALVTYRCNPGYMLVNGTGLRMCNCNNMWVGDSVYCVEINECLSSPCQYGGTCINLINMYKCTCPVRTNGTNCEIVSVPPVGPIPLPNVTDPGGIVTVNPRSDIECEQAPLFVNTRLINDGVLAGTTLNYECTEPGMAFTDVSGSDPTKRSIYCNGKGEWIPAPRGCEYIQCPYFRPPSGTRRDTEVRQYGVVATFHCLPGLSWPDGSKLRSILCESSGEWSSTIQPCRRPTCPDIKGFRRNCYVKSYTDGTANTPAKAQLLCQSLMAFPDGAPERNATCTSKGEWIPEDLTCDLRCIPPPWIENAPSGTIMTTTDKGAEVLVSCQLGYRYPDGQTKKKMSCNSDLTWDLNPPPCEEKVCEAVPVVGGATPSSKIALVGHNVTYTCEKYYWFLSLRNSSATIYCHIANVSWSEPPENCSEIHCGPKEVVPNADYDNSIADTPEMNVTYTCQGTKRFVNGKSMKVAMCTFQGTWTEIADNCDENRCPYPNVPSYSKPTEIIAAAGSVINFTCHNGYTYPDKSMTKFIKCETSLNWNATLPDCEPIICPVLHDKPSVRVTSKNHTFSAQVNVSCARGYRFSDGSGDMYKSVTCTMYSTWTLPMSAITCEKIKCEKPRVAQYCWPSPVKYSVWDQITYYCKTGFNFKIGQWYRDISCQETGTWSDEKVKEGCSVIQCPFPTWTYGSWNSTNFVVFSAINYTCPVNQTFKDRTAVKIATCMITSKWSPPLETCYDINDEVFKVEPTDAKGADKIGIVAAIFCSIVLGLIVSLDIGPACAKVVMRNN